MNTPVSRTGEDPSMPDTAGQRRAAGATTDRRTPPKPGGASLDGSGSTVGRALPTLADTVRAYLTLTKPRIIELLLVTAVPSMVIAADGWPGSWLVVATMIGGVLTAGSANTFNNYLDRDVDARMGRTAGRPVASGRVSPDAALVFGVVLGAAGFAWLAGTVNLLAASLATAAIAFYVFVYTIGLKRRTTQAVVIGGAAGCVPVLVGWAAVTGSVALEAWVLFAIVFYWTPPHFWALAIRYRDEYAQAGLPMLPVTRGAAETARHVVYYSYLLVAVTLAWFPLARAGVAYLAGVGLLNGIWLVLAHRLKHRPTARRAMTLFRYSTMYLAFVFALAALDALMV